MTNEIIFVVKDSPKGGCKARALEHSLFTEADALEELCDMILMLLPVTLMTMNVLVSFGFTSFTRN